MLNPSKIAAIALMATLSTGIASSANAAQAQPYAHAGEHASGNAMRHTPMRAEAIRNQIDQLARAVERNDLRNRVSEREANALRRDVRNLREQFRRDNRNGLSRQEAARLESRINTIRVRLHAERIDRDGRRY